MAELDPSDRDVLIVIDPQNDFCPGGALAVPGGDKIMVEVNRLAERFDHVVLTQDWHPPGQISFASTHGGRPFETFQAPYGEQMMWPDHCVQGTPGADFHPAILAGPAARKAELVIRKGHHQQVDSYSAFFENDRTTPTGLSGYLRERGFRRCVFVGLALDFCVRYSAEDARREGFEATVLEQACRAIDMAGSLSAAADSFRRVGVELIS